MGLSRKEIRADCRFCRGRGCLNCDTLAEREYRRQFPKGPELVASFTRNDPEDLLLLRQLLQGVHTARTPKEIAAIVTDNAQTIRRLQEHLATTDREDQP
jgi:hypothetical protein